MSEDLQSLLDKINREGVDKAREQADKIIADAEAQAAEIVKQGEAQVAKFKAEAQVEAEAFTARSQDTLKQAARDVVLSIEQAVARLLAHVLAEDVDAALLKNDVIDKLVTEALSAYATGKKMEIVAGAQVVDMLRTKLAQKPEVTVVTNESLGTGFKVRLNGGRVEHDFTGATVSAALAKLLRPQLAALLEQK